MEFTEFYGIMASISWDSEGWKGEPKQEDIDSSGYQYVQDEEVMFECLNFGHLIYPPEEGGYFIAYTPKFNRLPDKKKTKFVKAIFLITNKPKQATGKRQIVGIYGFPDIGHDEWFDRTAILHPLYKKYNSGNIRSKTENIILFENSIEIDNQIVKELNLLPESKDLTDQGFNYLTSENVLNILSLAIKFNSENDPLILLANNLGLKTEYIDFWKDYVPNYQADTLKGIKELEEKIMDLTPIRKERISSFIERGAIARKIKIFNQYKCLVCEALGIDPHGFKKENGQFYIETHHIIPVSNLEKGSLSVANLITVCANHHRQFHYGNVEILTNDILIFKALMDGTEINIRKVEIE